MYQSKCDSCGDLSYIFPDQIETIKKNDNLALHKFCKGKLKVGDAWFCIKCDASKKDGTRCKIFTELPSKKAKSLISIRKRETKLKDQGFILPEMY